MKLRIIRIDEKVVTCELEDYGLLDISKQWLSQNIKVGDVIDFAYEKHETKQYS